MENILQQLKWKEKNLHRKQELLYLPAGTLLMEYTIAVGGNVGMGTLIIFGSGLLPAVVPLFPSDGLRLLLT